MRLGVDLWVLIYLKSLSFLDVQIHVFHQNWKIAAIISLIFFFCLFPLLLGLPFYIFWYSCWTPTGHYFTFQQLRLEKFSINLHSISLFFCLFKDGQNKDKPLHRSFKELKKGSKHTILENKVCNALFGIRNLH